MNLKIVAPGSPVFLGARVNSQQSRNRRFTTFAGTLSNTDIVFVPDFSDSGANHCPGFEDCQGFVPPCKNCNDPDNWHPIATTRLDGSLNEFETISRLQYCNFFGLKPQLAK